MPSGVREKFPVHLFQVNYSFADGHFLPYSIGSIAAFCRTQADLDAAFDFRPLGHRREPLAAVLGRLVAPAVLGLSSYVWNWEWNLSLARSARDAHPDCLIVMGGPQVPDSSNDFFRAHPYVDVLVHGEGEAAFAEILRRRLDHRGEPTLAWLHDVSGLSVRGVDRSTFRTPRRARLESLDALPSPYVEGVFDDILDEAPRWSASQETNRGCPYSCTFCDWGSAVFSRVRHFPEARVLDEIAWFGEAGIDIVYNCDANFGMFEQDVRYADALAAARRKRGAPGQFRTSYAKKSDDRVFAIAAVLLEAGLQKGVGVSLQSLDKQTLTTIKRRNLTSDRFAERMVTYRHAGIPTYTELIVGLPGETLGSFEAGIDAVLDGGQHEGLLIYPCQVLPNAELADPAYRHVHGIATVSTPLRLGYATVEPGDLDEHIDIITSTRTMPPEDWLEAYVFGLVVQAFHCLNLTQVVAVLLRSCWALPYQQFYRSLMAYGSERSTGLLGELVLRAREAAMRIQSGSPAGVTVRLTGTSVWNPEEAMFLEAVLRKDDLAVDLATFLTEAVAADLPGVANAVPDLVRLQIASLVGPLEPQSVDITLDHDLISPLENAYEGRSASGPLPVHTRVSLNADRASDRSLPDYALDMLRYGRKDNHLRRRVVAVP